MKKIITVLLTLALVLTIGSAAFADEGQSFTVGICNFVDDASLNQIIANIRSQLKEIEEKENVTFVILEDNCNTAANVINQIITNFMADKVDLMVGVATPVAMAMQAATEDSSKAPIAAAKAYLDEKGVAYVERTGTSVDEVMLAADALVSDGVDAVFTPTDNTIMTAELAIYETFAEAGIPHYTGADSFALNGAFLGYGVDYANLGLETGNMIADILLNGKNPGEVPVMTFDNGTATVNTDTCELLGLDYDAIAEAFAPFCTKVQAITTAESFDDLA